jgi:HEPN domain-containing protein
MANRRRHNTADSRRYYDWLDRAAEDMKAADILEEDEFCFYACAFHCQQTIEKALKAYVLLKTDRLLDGHNLTWLCKQAARYDSQFQQWLPESAALNRCYIETRYPTDIPMKLQEKQVKNYMRIACEMYIFICNQVDEELDRREAQNAAV